MTRSVVVLVEWRGTDLPAVVWRGKHGYEQWLSPEIMDQMGMCRYSVFYAEFVEGVWHIGKACDTAKAEIKSSMIRDSASRNVAARPLGSPPSRRESC